MVKENTSILDAGMHNVAVEDIEFVENKYDPDKERLQITLQSLDEEKSIRFWTSPNLSPKGKLMPFCEAVLERPLNDGEKTEGFDIEEFIGKKLCVIVKSVDTENGKKSKVTDFVAVKQEEDSGE